MVEKNINEAFERFPREWFLPPADAGRAGINTPIAIGYGQTNSQPSTVRQMLTWLNVQRDAHVLDVGSGSGWTTALLSYLVGRTGDVIAVELVPELVAFGRKNCKRAGVENAVFHQARETYGWPQAAPYDNILVSASADSLPNKLLEQLQAPGTLVMPIKDTVYVIVKDRDGSVAEHPHPGYIFVPLLEPE